MERAPLKNIRVIGFCGIAGSGKDTAAEILQEHGYSGIAFADSLKRIGLKILDGAMSEEACFGPSELRSSLISYSMAKHKRAMSIIAREGFGFDRLQAVTLYDEVFHSDAEVILWTRVDGSITVRSFLQRLGTDWGREMVPDYWIDELYRVLQKLDVPLHEQVRPVYSRTEGVIENVKMPGMRLTDASYKGDFVVTDVRFPNEIEFLRSIDADVFWIDTSSRLKGRKQDAHVSEPKDNVRAMFDEKSTIDNNGTLEQFRENVQEAVYDATQRWGAR